MFVIAVLKIIKIVMVIKKYIIILLHNNSILILKQVYFINKYFIYKILSTYFNYLNQ